MDERYSAGYAELYRKHWWWRARERFLLEQLRRLELPQQGISILDVGCGDGLFLPRLAELGEVWGVEPGLDVLSADNPWKDRIYRIPFDNSFAPGRQFTLILMLDVLEHLPDPEGALRVALDLLEPRGTIVITVPAFPVLWTSHDDLNRHYIRYTRTTLHDVAARAGLRIRHIRYFFHWLFLPKLLVRAAERVAGRRASPPRIPPAWLNRVLTGLTRLDHAWTLPWGSSLLAAGGRAPAGEAAAQAEGPGMLSLPEAANV